MPDKRFRLPSTHPENRKLADLFRKTPGYGGPGSPISTPIDGMGRRKIEPDSFQGWLGDFLDQDIQQVEWVIKPLLPKGGTVFFHGGTSVGKSPFTWALATSVSEGIPFCGYPVNTPGVVLYIELDTPANLIHPRLRLLKVQPGAMWLECHYGRPIDICGLGDDSKLGERFRRLNEELNPVLVVVNTLRKAHTEDDKDSSTPSRVYGAWREYFPHACHLFAHHDRKTPTDKKANINEDQMFSGSQHWADDATTALHIKRMKAGVGHDPTSVVEATPDDDGYKKTPVTIRMTKSQVWDHERFPALQMRLDRDGTNWIETGPAAYRVYFETLDKSEAYSRRVERVMEHFDIQKSAAYAACKGLD